MANQDAAFGFKPTRHLTGGKIRSEEYAIAANHGTSIFNGQRPPFRPKQTYPENLKVSAFVVSEPIKTKNLILVVFNI